MGSSRCLLGLVTLTVMVSISAQTRGEEAVGWALGRKTDDLTALGLSILNLKSDSGLQLAVFASSIKWGAAQRFSVGVGYDDMVTAHDDGSVRQDMPITERLFLLQTPCDKRFQLTVQFRW